jgi:hypothetical protein
MNAGPIIAGDFQPNNAIDIIDVSLFSTGYNAVESDTEYNPIFDLNCTGNINILDISNFSVNFGMVGDSPPLDYEEEN